MDLNINEGFRDLIPPLSEHELAGLEEDIKHFGCHSPIIVWNDTIIDGHHRYAICRKHGLPFKTEERQFEDEDAVMIWMIDNQMGRRNINNAEKIRLAMKKIDILSRAAEGRKLSTLKQFQTSDNEQTTDSADLRYREGKVAEHIAKTAGVSARSVEQFIYIQKHAPEMADSLCSGQVFEGRKLSIDGAYNDLRRDKARAELKQSLESIEAKEAKALAGVYDVIVIDPPWDIKKIERDVAPEQVDLDYPTMSLDEIKGLDVPCADDCHIFLWTTQKFLRPSFEILESWGLTYVCLFTWLKNGGFQPFNLPQFNTEFVLYAHKGNPKFVDLKQFNCGFRADRGRHSEKPEAFYDVIRRVTGGRRLDMFNRRRIDGFDGWGKEAI